MALPKPEHERLTACRDILRAMSTDTTWSVGTVAWKALTAPSPSGFRHGAVVH